MAKTGYKIITYIDVNPQSPTFNTTKEERELDSECDAATSSWEVVSSYCEVDDNGANTGFYITTEMDTNLDSPTYGQTRENKEYNVNQCQLASTDPQWAINEEKSYCEVQKFPSGLEGNTGRYIISMTDENRSSSTYGQTKESALTESDWTEEMKEEIGDFPCQAVDTEPQIEAISQSCVLVECSGQTTTNGYKTVYGIDRNPYSMTYLNSISGTVVDNENCPNNCGGSPVEPTYVFTLSDGSTSAIKNVESSAQTLTFNVVSTKDGMPQGWVISSGSATKTSNGISVSLSENTSTSTTKTTNITLKQNDSNKTISIKIIQAKKEEEPTPVETYVFTWSDGTIVKNETHDYTAGDMTFSLISTKDGAAQSWSVASKSSLISVSTASTSITVSMIKIGDHTDQTHNVALRQSGSNNVIMLEILQTGQPQIVNDFRFEETNEDTLRHNFEASGFTEIHTFIISMLNGSMEDFTYSSDASWFKVTNVRKATANEYYDVSTKVDENDTVLERVGTITFTQNTTGDKLYIIATQKGKRCTPSTYTCYQISNSAMTHTVVAATDTENELTWDYTAVTTTINELCEETVTTESGSSSSTISFSENTGDADKTISGYIILDKSVCGGDNIINYSFTQRGAKKYTFSYKDGSTAKSLSLAWDEEQSEVQVYSYWHIDEGSTVNLGFSLEGEQPSWCQVVTTSDYIRIFPNESNTGSSNHSESLTFVQNESGKKITLNVSQTYKDFVPSNVIRIQFSSTYPETISIWRFRIKFSGNTSYSYVTVNSGPIYQGSISSKDITYTSQSTRNKKIVVMYAEESDGTSHPVSLPGSSISSSPKFKFSSNYFRAGTIQTLTISP